MSASRPPPSAPTLARVARRVPLALAGAATVYAALRARPEMRGIPGMPLAWGNWLDAHDFLKNAVGFAVLAVTTHWAFPRHVLRNAVVLAVLVAGFEGAQLFLPQRMPDADDVAAGWLGVALATGCWGLVARRVQRSSP